MFHVASDLQPGDGRQHTTGLAFARTKTRLARVWASGWWLPLLIAIVVTAINPIGYLGGGADDSQYLAAARCWIEHGACIPQNHWATRWTLVAPLAAIVGWLGESRTTAAILPALWWIGAVVAAGLLGERLFGRRAGVAAASLLALVPIFADVALSIGVDIPELTFQLAAVLAALTAVSRQSRGWAIMAGLMAGLAFETRETSVAFLAAAALVCALSDRHQARVLAWSLVGLAAVIGTELVIYGIVTGDVFYRYELSLRHGSLFSSELDPSVDRTRSPILNPAFIAGWKREMGIRLFWPLDPWLNLLASPRIGEVFVAAIAAAILWWKELPTPHRRWCRLLAFGAVASATVLIYVLASDPKPRMFFGPAAAATLVLGALLSAAWSNGSRTTAALLVGALAAFELMAHAQAPSRLEEERIARAWIASDPGQIEIDPAAADLLAMVKESRPLPPRGAGRPILLAMTTSTCSALISAHSKARILAAEANANQGRGGICLMRY